MRRMKVAVMHLSGIERGAFQKHTIFAITRKSGSAIRTKSLA